MSLRIRPRDVDKTRAEARVLVRASGLPDVFADVDAGAFGTTPLNLEMLAAVAGAAAAALTAAPRLPAKAATSLFVAFIFAEEALARLNGISGQAETPLPDGSLPPREYRELAGDMPDKLIKSLLKDARDFVRFYRGHPDSGKRLTRDVETLKCLRAYFRLLANTAKSLSPDDAACDLETPRLAFKGWTAAAISLEEPTRLLDISLDDIVGNEDYLAKAKRLARDIAGFDFAKGANPKKVRNQILFVLGSPGCGKTVTAHAVLRYFLDLCAQNKIPATTRVIRRTDWASSYQNQSASRLLEIFREEVFNAPGVCGVYWPDIDTAFSARGDSHLRQEEKANLGTLFGILDGTIGPKNGKWFLICDANTMHMDEAMVSRLAQTPLQAFGPKTPEDFIRLLRDIKLRGKGKWLTLSDGEWAELGTALVDNGLSGRAVDAIAGRVLTEIEDFEEPEEYFAMSFADKRKLIDELSRPVDAAALRRMVEDFCRFEKAAQEKSEEEAFRRRVEEIRRHLSAQRAAIADFTREGAGGSTHE